MDLLKYLKPMKNTPERFSNLAFWRGVRKLRDKMVDTFEYVGEWGNGIEGEINSLKGDITHYINYQKVQSIVYDNHTFSEQIGISVSGNEQTNIVASTWTQGLVSLESSKTYIVATKCKIVGTIAKNTVFLQRFIGRNGGTNAIGEVVDGFNSFSHFEAKEENQTFDGIFLCKFTPKTDGDYGLGLFVNRATGTFNITVDIESISVYEYDLALAKPLSKIVSQYVYLIDGVDNELIEKILPKKEYPNIADLIGDSLTGGALDAGGEPIKYQNHLQELLPDWDLRNYGAGSEQANAISARCGGIGFYIMPCELSTTATEVQFVDEQYRNFFVTSSIDWTDFYLEDGTKIIVTRTGQSSNTKNLVALESGTKSITRPMAIYTDFIKNDNSKNVGIICIGANGGFNNQFDLAKQVRNIIDANGYERYLVLAYNASDVGVKNTNHLTRLQYLAQEFGSHFVNVYDYLIKYGLQDAGIIPTEADETDISLSIIPESLRLDGIHYNEICCKIVAELIYKQGKLLGYW